LRDAGGPDHLLGRNAVAIELSDCRTRRERMVVIGSMVSSLSFLIFPRSAATSTRRDVRCIAHFTRRSGPVRSLSFATAGCVPPTPRCARVRTSGRSRISRCSSASRILAALPVTTIDCLASTRPKRGSGTGRSLICHNGKSARYRVQPRAYHIARMRMLVQPSLRAQ
jgi:hypothetical protein